MMEKLNNMTQYKNDRSNSKTSIGGSSSKMCGDIEQAVKKLEVR